MSDLLAGRGGLHYKSEGGKEWELQGHAMCSPTSGLSACSLQPGLAFCKKQSSNISHLSMSSKDVAWGKKFHRGFECL